METFTAAVQASFFLVLGVGLVLIALQGASRGWLPNGPNGFRRGEGVHRRESPLMFWFFFALYGGGGLALTVLAIQLFLGNAAPFSPR
jgi:hypothetical protein